MHSARCTWQKNQAISNCGITCVESSNDGSKIDCMIKIQNRHRFLISSADQRKMSSKRRRGRIAPGNAITMPRMTTASSTPLLVHFFPSQASSGDDRCRARCRMRIGVPLTEITEIRNICRSQGGQYYCVPVICVMGQSDDRF